MQLPVAGWGTTFTYDALNRLTAVKNSGGASVTYSYDAAGNLTAIGVTADTTPPTIVSRRPAVDAVGVPVGIPISIIYSEAITEESALAAVAVTSPAGTVPGHLAWNVDSIIFTPEVPLQIGTAYTVTVTGVRDLTANLVAASATWHFSTVNQADSTVIVHFSGDGSGTVTSSHPVFSCTKEPCSGQFPTGTEVSLYPTASFDAIFAGWQNGPCSGPHNCVWVISGPTSVMARFDLMPPVRTGGSPSPVYYQSLNDACNATSTGSIVVEAMARTFSENLILNQNLDVTLKGGFDVGYEAAIGYTVVKGLCKIRKGRLIADRLVIE
jgi:YD repeat-containing protein